MVAAAAIERSIGGSSLHPSPLGGAATSVFYGRVADLDENTATRAEKWRGEPGILGESQKMLTDPHVRTGRDVVVDPVVAAEWDFEPGGKRPIDLEAAALARWVFFKRLPWKRHLGDLMRAYWSDGFAVVEKTDDLVPFPREQFPLHPEAKHTGLAVAITGLFVRPGWSIDGWEQDPTDATKVRGVRQYIQGSDVERARFEPIPSERFLRFSWEQVGANYEGNAQQRSVWGPWFVKRLLTRIEAMGHEKNHLAQPIAEKTDPNAGSDDDDKKLLTVLSAFKANEKGAQVLPFGYKLVWSEHGQQTNIAETITRCNFDIAHGSASGFMLLGQAEGPGSYALAGTQSGQFELMLQKHADFICDVFNFGTDGWSIVERIVRLNYGKDVAVPQLVVRYLPTVDFEKTLPVLAKLVEKRIIQVDDRLEAYARRGLKAPEADPDSRRELPTPVAIAPVGSQPKTDDEMPAERDEELEAAGDAEEREAA